MSEGVEVDARLEFSLESVHQVLLEVASNLLTISSMLIGSELLVFTSG